MPSNQGNFEDYSCPFCFKVDTQTSYERRGPFTLMLREKRPNKISCRIRFAALFLAFSGALSFRFFLFRCKLSKSLYSSDPLRSVVRRRNRSCKTSTKQFARHRKEDLNTNCPYDCCNEELERVVPPLPDSK